MPTTRDQLKNAPKTKLSIRKFLGKDHPAMDDFAEGSFRTVPLEMINPNPDQPRQIFDPDKLKELSDSVKENGMLQPVIIRVDAQKNFFLVAGERRLRAARMAGLELIPCMISRGNPAEIALIENLQREDLKPIEEAEALNRMIDEYGYSQEQLARVVNKAKSTISEALSLTKLPSEIKDEARQADHYPRRLLVEIAKQKTPGDMLNLFERVKAGRLKSDQVRKIARREKERTSKSPAGIALERSLGLSQLLSKLNPEAVAEPERRELFTALQNLRNLIGQLLG
jgi:ParB family chromosome partitioning protein